MRPNREGGPRRAGNRPPGSVSLVTGSRVAEHTESGGRRSSLLSAGRQSSSSSSSRWRLSAAASDASVSGAIRESTVFGSPPGSVANHWRRGPTGSWRERFRAVGRSDTRGSSSSIAKVEARSERPGEPTRARRARVSGLRTRLDHRPEPSAFHPGRRVCGPLHGTTECWEPGSASQRFLPPRTFRSGSTLYSPSGSHCSQRRRPSPKVRPRASPRRSCSGS
jgi:hypothetical protein